MKAHIDFSRWVSDVKLSSAPSVVARRVRYSQSFLSRWLLGGEEITKQSMRAVQLYEILDNVIFWIAYHEEHTKVFGTLLGYGTEGALKEYIWVSEQ